MFRENVKDYEHVFDACVFIKLVNTVNTAVAIYKLDKYRDGAITLDLGPLNNEHLAYISSI